jgi:iron(III) transport system substrate-binding protein
MSSRMLRSAALAGGAVLALAAGQGGAQAQGQLVLYCAVQEEWCRAMSTAFEKETGIKVAMTRKSSGEFYAQLKAESANPRGDVWWGGTGDPHQQAAEEGLTQENTSPNFPQLHDWSLRQHKDTGGRTIGIYTGALGFGYNEKLLKAKGLPEPKCWADLINPKFKDEVQVADPNSSGTSYTMLATIVQLIRRGQGLRLAEAAAQEHQPVHQIRRGPGQGDQPGRDDDRHHLHARHDRHGAREPRCEGGRAVRGHGLRDRLDVDRQGRQEPRQRQEVL